MEMLVIALVAIVAFAIVLIPLFRRDATSAEFAGSPIAAEQPPVRAAAERRPGPAAVPRDTAAEAAEAADPLEREVQRYRAAVRAGTVCSNCGQANPDGSAYCYECGERLPRAAAKEFE